eukprot:5816860-Amphidinium_carterae.1
MGRNSYMHNVEGRCFRRSVPGENSGFLKRACLQLSRPLSCVVLAASTIWKALLLDLVPRIASKEASRDHDDRHCKETEHRIEMRSNDDGGSCPTN